MNSQAVLGVGVCGSCHLSATVTPLQEPMIERIGSGHVSSCWGANEKKKIQWRPAPAHGESICEVGHGRRGIASAAPSPRG